MSTHVSRITQYVRVPKASPLSRLNVPPVLVAILSRTSLAFPEKVTRQLYDMWSRSSDPEAKAFLFRCLVAHERWQCCTVQSERTLVLERFICDELAPALLMESLERLVSKGDIRRMVASKLQANVLAFLDKDGKWS